MFYVGSHNLFSLINEEWLIEDLNEDNKVSLFVRFIDIETG